MVTGLVVVAGILALPQDGLEWIYGYVPGLGPLIDSCNKWFEPVSIVHLFLFAVVSLFVGWSCRPWSVFVLLVGLGLFATVTEVMQLWVPGRQVRLSDLVGNYLGILAGLGVVWIVRGERWKWEVES